MDKTPMEYCDFEVYEYYSVMRRALKSHEKKYLNNEEFRIYVS